MVLTNLFEKFSSFFVKKNPPWFTSRCFVPSFFFILNQSQAGKLQPEGCNRLQFIMRTVFFTRAHVDWVVRQLGSWHQHQMGYILWNYFSIERINKLKTNCHTIWRYILIGKHSFTENFICVEMKSIFWLLK